MATELEIPLAQLVRALRRELNEAVREGEDDDLRFSLGPIELDLQVTVGREAEGEAGIRFYVVTIGGKGSRSTAVTHTVKLKLDPVAADGETVLVEDAAERRPD
jgi:hypothetical protein